MMYVSPKVIQNIELYD